MHPELSTVQSSLQMDSPQRLWAGQVNPLSIW